MMPLAAGAANGSAALGGDHHCRDVFQLHIGAWRMVIPSCVRACCSGFAGERGLHGLVAGPVKADDQPAAPLGKLGTQHHRSQIADTFRA